ncbi:helix-hairpin-helix domain-containing protein [Patescibacteria group bacterium]|nr:helix-hairpin-helix domain-containing protein [Patescibacteria group bacterium]
MVGLGLLIPRLNLFKQEPVFESRAESQIQESLKIKVDIAGSVKKPDVYQLADGSRIEDAIDAAGGLSAKADKDWISKNLNLAQVIGDGTKIYIPRVDEFMVSSNTSGSSLGSTTNILGKVNINSASSSDLDTLPRIGPVTAQKIIDGRPYSSVEDLINNKVLGPKTYEGLKDLVSVQ